LDVFPTLEPVVVSPETAARLLNCSRTALYKLLASGELQSFVEGQRRSITTQSIRRYVARRLSAAGKSVVRPNTKATAASLAARKQAPEKSKSACKEAVR
jgi:excisionase family DNA binding protein